MGGVTKILAYDKAKVLASIMRGVNHVFPRVELAHVVIMLWLLFLLFGAAGGLFYITLSPLEFHWQHFSQPNAYADNWSYTMSSISGVFVGLAAWFMAVDDRVSIIVEVAAVFLYGAFFDQVFGDATTLILSEKIQYGFMIVWAFGRTTSLRHKKLMNELKNNMK